MVIQRFLLIVCLIIFSVQNILAEEVVQQVKENNTKTKKSKEEKPKIVTLDSKIAIQNAKLLAIQNLRKQLVKSRQDEIDTGDISEPVEMDFFGKLRRMGTTHDPKSPNLIDFIVEKKELLQDQSTLLHTQVITLSKTSYILNIWKGQPSFIEVLSADNSQIILKKDLDELNFSDTKLDKIDFFQNPVNANSATTGVIYTHFDQSLHSIKLMISNSTHHSFNILGKRVLENSSVSPDFIKSIRSKQGTKSLVVNQVTDELEIYSNDLAKKDGNIPLNLNGNEILGIQQQPQSLMIHTKREIIFVRMSTQQQKGKDGKPVESIKNACESKILDIDQVVNDVSNMNIFLAVSKSQNTIQIFETKGKLETFSCKSRGVLRFGADKINSISIQSQNSLIFITLLNSSQFVYIPYDVNNMVDSILAQKMQFIIQNNLYEFKSSDGKSPKIQVIDRYLQIQDGSSTTLFENVFNPTTVNYQNAGVVLNSEPVERLTIWGKLTQPHIIQALVIPVAIFIVLIYQLYFRKPTSTARKSQGAQSKEALNDQISKRVSNLSQSMGGISSNQPSSHSSNSQAGKPYQRPSAGRKNAPIQEDPYAEDQSD